MKKTHWNAFLVFLAIGALILANTSFFVVTKASTDVNSMIITSNTTWTRTNSPYTLLGPVAVNRGVTLTIEAGTTILLNNYYIQINGTLRARGIGNDIIQFNNGSLIFTSAGVGWNDTTGLGSIIEYANFTLTSMNTTLPIKLNNNFISGGITLDDLSIVTNNYLASGAISGDNCTFTNNSFGSGLRTGAYCNILNNTVELSGVVTGDYCTITRNVIGGGVSCSGNSSAITNNTIVGSAIAGTITNNVITGYGNVAGNIISNNNIIGTVKPFGSSTVSNNVIKGGGSYIETDIPSPFGRYSITYYYGAIDPSDGSPTIFGNIIEGGITDNVTLSSPKIFNNTITTNGKDGIAVGSSTTAPYFYSAVIAGNPEIYNNTVGNSTGAGIFVYANSCNISRNIVNGQINAQPGTSSINENIATRILVTGGGSTITGNNVSGITYIGSTSFADISDNTISSGSGINGANIASIKRNYVFNNTVGIDLQSGTATIQNNTIASNGLAIRLYPDSSLSRIEGNNIQNNNQNIYLVLGSGWHNDINATNNWWGTTNTTAISQTIRDVKNDFNLGAVIFIPLLNAANPAAMPNPNASNNPPVIPEQFSSTIIFTLLAVATFAGIVELRKKTQRSS